LDAFSFDLDEGILYLTFDETVNSSSLVQNFITLQNVNVDERVTLKGGDILSSPDPVVQLMLTFEDLNSVKKSQMLAINNMTTFINLLMGTVLDMAYDPNPSVATNNLRVDIFTDDTTPPMLLGWIANVNSSQFTLRFDEPVHVETLMVQSLTVQLSPSNMTFSDPSTYYTLMYGSSDSPNGLVVVVDVHVDDLNEIKEREGLLVSMETSYLSFPSTLIRDMRGNSVVSIHSNNATQANNFIGDVTRPYIARYHLDMDSGTIHLTFPETVNATSVQFTSFVLQSDSFVSNNLYYYRLTGGSLVDYNDSTVVSIVLLPGDLNAIKARDIGMSTATSFLVVDEFGIEDQNGQQLVPVANGYGLQAAQYTIDVTRPTLVSFDLDLNMERLLLNFSETVRSSSISITTITIQGLNSSSTDEELYSLRTSTVVTPSLDGHQVEIVLSDFDLNELKRRVMVATANETTYISVKASTAYDTQRNYLIPIPPSLGQRVSVYTADMMPPVLMDFTLDVDSGNLTLTFDETVNATSLQTTVMEFIGNGSILYRLTGGLVIECYDNVITMNLNDLDLNRIKFIDGLCDDPTSDHCILHLPTGSVVDMAGNGIRDVHQPPTTLLPDVSQPTLLWYDLDLTAETLTLMFSEAVRPQLDHSSTIRSIVLQSSLFERNGESLFTGDLILNTSSPDIYDGQLKAYILSDGVLSGTTLTSGHPPMLVIKLTRTDLDILKSLESVATLADNTYLLIKSDAVSDFADPANQLVEIRNTVPFAQRVRVYTPDTVRPYLTRFELDVDSGVLTLSFSETVNASSLDPLSITLAGSQEEFPSDTFTLRGGVTTSFDNPVISLQLTVADLNSIKNLTSVATGYDDTYLSFTSTMISDQAGNAVVPVNTSSAEDVDLFFPDITGPQLVSWVLDLDEGLLLFTFSETVNSETFDHTLIAIQDGPQSQFVQHYIGNGTLLSPDGTEFTFRLSDVDLNAVKLMEVCTVGANGDDCYISFSNTTVLDMNRNAVVARLNGFGERVSQYISDTTPPRITSFVVNMTFGDVVLFFDEAVNVSTFDPTSLTTYQSNVASSVSYTLTGGDRLTVMNGLRLEFTFTSQDIREIQVLSSFYSLRVNTFLGAANTTIQDMSGNYLTPLDPLIVSEFHPDELGPFITAALLNLTAGTLHLTFSESVRTVSFRPNQITLQNAYNATSSYTLTGGNFSSGVGSTNRDTILLTLSENDLKEIQARETLAVSTNTTWIIHTASLVADLVEEPGPNLAIARVNAENAFRAEFYNDFVDPAVFQFEEFSFRDRHLIISFNEPVDISNVNSTLFVIQQYTNNADLFGRRYSLTGGNVSYIDAAINMKTKIRISLNREDFKALLLDDLIASTELNTFLSLPRGAVNDFAGNPLVHIPENMGQHTVLFVRNDVPPSLTVWDLDVDSGLLTLEFDNVVDVTTLAATAVTIQNAVTRTASHTLTGGNTTGSNDYVVAVNITVDDLNEIKRITEIATSENDTYITFTADLIDSYVELNMPGLDVVAITDTSTAVQRVRTLTPDTTSPYLVNFTLDLNSDQLVLTFDETVRAASFQFLELRLTNTLEPVENDTRTFPLTTRTTHLGPPTTWSRSDDTMVTVYVGFEDVNELKRYTDIGTGYTDTFLYFSNVTLVDMNNNSVVPVYDAMADQVDVFIPDGVDPFLVNFTLDMNTGLLDLTFSETVNVSSLNTSSIQITGGRGSIDSVPLTTSSYPITTDHYIVTVFIGFDDLNALKNVTSVAQSLETTFIVITTTAVLDMSGNSVQEITSTDAKPALEFTEDTNNPELVAFDLDMDREVLTLTFNETIDIAQFVYTNFTFYSGDNITAADNYTLTHGTPITGNGRIVEIQLTEADVCALKLSLGLATSNESTFLELQPGAVKDTALVPNPSNYAFLSVGTFTPDRTPPMIVCYQVNVNTSELTIMFNEPVLSSSVQYSRYTFQGSNVGEYEKYKLTGGEVQPENGKNITITVTDYDLNEIKKLESLLVSQATTYLRVDTGAIADTNNNSILRLAPSDARMSCLFINDTIRPVLLRFDLDMDAGETLTLHFSETVDFMSLNVSQITLLDSDVGMSRKMYRLTGGVVSMTDNTTLVVHLLTSDVNQLKMMRIGVNNMSTYIQVTSALVLDQFGVSNVEISVMPRPISQYIRDDTPPTLTNFTLDMNSDVLWLTFDETVSFATFNASYITLQNMEARVPDPFTFHSLSSQSRNRDMLDDPVQKVYLSKADSDELKRLYLLGTTVNDTYISVFPYIVEDVFGNQLVEIPSSAGLQADNVTVDFTSPALVGFSLNLTSEVLVLTFSETVNASSLTVTQLTLHAEGAPDAATQNYTLTHNSTIVGMDPVGMDSTVISIQLGLTDLNGIKELSMLAVSPPTTYLSATSDTIDDMSGNPVDQVPSSLPLNVTQYTRDIIRPQLDRFDFDVDAGLLVLYFDETVNGSSLRPNEVTLLGDPITNSSYGLTLSGAWNHTTAFTTEVEIYLLVSDLNEVKRQRGLAHNVSDTFLSITRDAISDMFDNNVVEIDEESAMMVSVFVNDSTNPRLVGFQLNLTSEILSLTFDETVFVETFNPVEISILSPNGSESVDLTHGTVLGGDSTIVDVKLIRDDLNLIKIETTLGTETSDTLISIGNQSIQDMNFNWNEPIPRNMSLLVDLVYPDLISPQLESFQLDMDGPGLMTLYFSESVNVSSLDVTRLTLVGGQDDPNAQNYTLTLTPGSTTNSTNGPVIQVLIGPVDFNEIKKLRELAIGVLTTYVSITPDLVNDMNTNPVVPIDLMSAVQVELDGFTPDTTPPQLVSFDLDLNSGELIMTFSETVYSPSLDPSSVTLQNGYNDSTQTLTLSPQYLELPNDIYLTLKLTDDELNVLKAMDDLGTNRSNTYLSILNTTVHDMVVNYVVPIPATGGLMARSVYSDTTPPKLAAFDLDVDAGILKLVFDETVDASTLNISVVTLQSGQSENATREEFTLTSSSTWTMNDSTVITILLSFYDLNSIKVRRHLASNESGGNTYLSLPEGTVRDMMGLPLVEVSHDNAEPVRNITMDTTQPQLVSFDFNLNSEQIILTFTEAVDHFTLVVSEFAIVANPVTMDPAYNLTMGSTPSSDDYIIVVQLSIDDVNNIKRDLNLAYDENTTHLVLTEIAIMDMNENTLNFTEPLQVTNFTADSRSPVLVAFDLDMNSDLLVLVFNETVRVPTLMIGEITLQDNVTVDVGDSNSSPSYHTLGFSSPLNLDDPTISIHLHPDDINRIKTYDNLASSSNNTFISMTMLALADMNGNYLTEIPSYAAERVRMFVRDTTPPVLVYYELDLTLEELRMEFNETVNVSSIDATQLSISNGNGNRNGTVSVQLTAGIIPEASNATQVTMRLTRTDLNKIKKLEDLAVSTPTSFLAVDPAFITDMAGNYIAAEAGKPAGNFVEDLVQPELESFHLDMNEGLLHLTFVETVRSSTLDPTGIVLLDDRDPNATVSYRLMGGSTNSTNDPVVTVIINETDLNNIKRLVNLGTSISDTFISFSDVVIYDMNNNSVVLINATEALQAEVFTNDTTSPNLISFDFDLDSDIFALTFDETVDASSLWPGEITFTDSKFLTDGSINYTLTQNSSVINDSYDDTIISVKLSLFDSNQIKKLVTLATNENNTFILMTALAILDMNSNPLVAVEAPFKVTNYTEDTTRPVLEGFVVDMDNRLLILYFSETVNSSSLEVDQVMLQDYRTALGPSVSLKDPSSTDSPNDYMLVLGLGPYDIYDITALTNLYTSQDDSYLTITSDTIADMNGNRVVSITNGGALKALDYLVDMSPPMLLNFTVDLDEWIVQLFFDEAIALDFTDFTKISVFSDEVGTINLTLTNGTFDTSYTHNITLHLIREDVNAIKVTEHLWTTQNNTWLQVSEGSVWDWTGNNTITTTVLRAEFDPIEDNPPNLVSFIANMTGGVLILLFDEPVRFDTLVPVRFSLENDADFPTTVFNLTGGQALGPNGLRIVFNFKYEDLNDVKARVDLFTSINDSYLTLYEGAIRDMVYNPSAPITRKQADFFFDDRIMPHLISYDLDMNEGLLFLSFYETVDVSSFNLPSIRLQRSFNVSELNEMSYHYFSTRTIASSTITMLDNRHVTLNISLDDLNEIKRKRIANSNETTWLVMSEDALVDNNNQTLLPLVNGLTALQVDGYTADKTSPELNGFYLDANDGTLTLLFSETVDAETLDITQFTLLNRKVNSTQSYRLTTSSLLQESTLAVASGDGVYFPQDFLDPDETPDFLIGLFENITMETNTSQPSLLPGAYGPLYTFNSPELVVYLSRFDLNEIKKLTSLATSNKDSFLSITTAAILDMVGNNVTAIATDDAQPNIGYTPDTTSPALLSYELDIDSGNLTLTFSETVNVSSLDTTQLTFHSKRNIWASDYINYTLNSHPPYPNTSASFSPNGVVVVVQIGHEDLDAMKNLRTLATSVDDTYLSWSNFTILDMAGNDVVERLPQFSRHTVTYMPDTTPPQLISFDLDLDDGRLIITFSETVKIRDTLNVTEITLLSMQGVSNDSLLNYTFTADPPYETSSMDDDSRVVMIRIGFTDLNAIKYRSSLATHGNNTHLSLTNATVLDLNDNAVVGVDPPEALPVRIHTPDTTPPILVNFTLDMDASVLILTFNETVNSSSLAVDQVTLQHAPLSSSAYHSRPLVLTPGDNETFTDSDNDYIITVTLGPTDGNELKRRQNLGISRETTYIVITDDAIMDMNMNMLTPIKDGDGKVAQEFIPDETSPFLTEFSIDMNSGHIVLTFDETVNASTLKTTDFTLLDSSTGTGTNVTFTPSTTSDQSDNTTILVSISIQDLNEIKRNLICRQISDCYLIHNNASVYDMVGNPIVARRDDSTLQVTGYSPDETRPRLVSFAVNLTSEEFLLTFDETVNATSLNFSAFTLQDFFSGEFTYTLTGGVGLSAHSTIITFLFSLEDLNAVKRMTTIYTDRPNSWLTFTQHVIDDLALRPNPVMPIADTDTLFDSIVADELYPDFVQPELESFDLNLTSNQLMLYFSETIRTRTFMIDQITIQNSQYAENVTQAYNLTSSSVLADPLSDFHMLTINLGFTDLLSLKVLTELATEDNNTFLSITSGLVYDMNSNPIVSIDTDSALGVDAFMQDQVRPQLVSFDRFDVNGGLLLLQFDEPVNVSSFDVTQIQIRSSSSNASSFVQLTDSPAPLGSHLVSLVNSHKVGIAIGADDLNAIKEDLDLARNDSTTYLTFSEYLVADMNGNLVVSQSGVRVISFIDDTTPPELVEFCLNLTSEILSLTFSESVRVDTFQQEEIILQSFKSVSTADEHLYHQLSRRGTILGMDNPVVDIMLGSSDINMITGRTELATSIEDTFIAFSLELVKDMVGISVVAVPRTDAVRAVCFQNDTVSPVLSSFLLDMNTGILHLTFDETVNSSCFNRSLVLLQNGPSASATTSHSPSDESRIVSPLYSTVISLLLTTTELNLIKSQTNFATSSANVFLIVEEGLVKDMNLNPSESKMDLSGNFTADTTRPQLMEYHLDLIKREITFVFDEPIDSTDIVFSEITLQDMRSADDLYPLTGGTPTANHDSTVITVALNPVDSQHLRRNPSLTTSVNDTFIMFTEDAFHDTAVPPNPIEPLVDVYNATRVRTFVYYPPPLFTSIRPTAGRASGGTLVTVQGGNFGPVSSDPMSRQVDVFLDFNSASDVEVTVANVTLTASTPPADNTAIDSTVTLTLVIDDSALMLNISDVYRYLPPPVFTSLFPTTASQFGGTLLTIFGQYFGPSTASNEGPVVEVAIGNGSCSNVTVLSDTVLTCYSPDLDPGPTNITVTVDEVSTVAEDAFTAVEPPIVLLVTPDSTHTTTPSTTVTITGINFGPLTSSNSSGTPSVYFTAELRVTECKNVRVVIDDSTIMCEVGPNLGPANITVVYDGVTSEGFPGFVFYDDAGYFSFQSAEFFVSETAMFGNVTVIRHGYPSFASPTNVTISAFDGTALAGAHFIALNDTKLMPSDQSTLVFQVEIIASMYEMEKIRRGVVDDNYINLKILSVNPLHGIAAIRNGTSILTIKAVCQTVTTTCVAQWDLHTVKYYRVDELPPANP
jgi:hypothetical protein